MNFNQFLDLIYLMIDIHSKKILLLTTAVITCLHVDGVHAVLLNMAVVGILVKSTRNRGTVVSLILCVVAILILTKMIFQTDFIYHHPVSLNCTQLENSQSFKDVGFVFAPNAEWFGYYLKNFPAFQGYFTLLSLATIFRIIHINIIAQRGGDVQLPEYCVLFPGTHRHNFDYGVVDAFKYLLNYGFYKFGLEVCQIALALVCAGRRDVMAVVYGLCLLISIPMHRTTARHYWPLLSIFIAITILYQYLMVLGAFPSLCFEYPWPAHSEYLIKWLYLPYHDQNLSSTVIVGDVVLLLLVRQQTLIFHLETTATGVSGGSNDPGYHTYGDPNFESPVPDHTINELLGIDFMKRIAFTCLYWGSLAVSFMAGMGADLLALGYLAGAFFIIWQGVDVFLWEVKSLTRWWRFFSMYAAFSIVAKSAMTEISCKEQQHLAWEWIFNVATGSLCSGRNVLYWEILALCLFLLQLRYFQSPYFHHQVSDIQVSMKLQSSGATLIRQLRRQRLKQENKTRRDLIGKIKEDMDIIRAYTKAVYTSTTAATTHDQAVFAGEYYMFEDAQRFRPIITALTTPRGSLVKKRRSMTFDEFVESLRERRASNIQESKRQNAVDRNNKSLLPPPDKNSKKSDDDNRQIEEKDSKQKARALYALSWISNLIEAEIIPIVEELSRNYRLVAWSMHKDKLAIKKHGGQHYDEYTPTVPDMDDFERHERERKSETSALGQLGDALWYALIAHSELLCYLAVFGHQIMLPSLLSIPLPLLVLLWGALTPDHPSQTFWTTVTAYTQLTIILKALFRNSLFTRLWNNSTNTDIFYPPSIIGITQQGVLSSGDVLLLIILFIHRRKLKDLGLWEDRSQKDTGVSKNTIQFISSARPGALESFLEHLKPVRNFFRGFKDERRLPADVYVYIFLCDFFTFVIIFFGFSSFSPQAAGGGGDKFYLVENEVPGTYLATLIIQFFVIIVDRVLYLKKNIHGKLVFHFLLVIVAHIWIFIVLPGVTYRAFDNLVWPQLWYTFKYISFLLSAYQLRTGYPLRVGGHFLCRKYNMKHLYTFKVLKMIPFFSPIRQILNWICFKTSLTLYEWLMLCSMNAVIFETKCSRNIAGNYPKPRGEPVKKSIKLSSGLLTLLILLLIIWSPLLLFALFNTVSEPSPPSEAIFIMRINTFQDLYYYQMHGQEIKPLSQDDYERMRAQGRLNTDMRLFLDQYDHHDVAVLMLNQASKSSWTISPAQMAQMENILRNATEVIELQISWELKRQEGSETTTAFGEYKTPLNITTRAELLKALSDRQQVIHIHTRVPLYIENKRGRANTVVLTQHDGFLGYGRLVFTLKTEDKRMWWEVADKCQGPKVFKRQMTKEDCEKVTIYVFTPKRIPGILQVLSAKGILGLYATVVLLIWSVLRQIIEMMYQYVKYYWLPNVDSVIQLSKDIHLARECEELTLEEDLYAKLIFLFRSPETMIKWTRFTNDDDNGRKGSDDHIAATDIDL